MSFNEVPELLGGDQHTPADHHTGEQPGAAVPIDGVAVYPQDAGGLAQGQQHRHRMTRALGSVWQGACVVGDALALPLWRRIRAHWRCPP